MCAGPQHQTPALALWAHASCRGLHRLHSLPAAGAAVERAWAFSDHEPVMPTCHSPPQVPVERRAATAAELPAPVMEVQAAALSLPGAARED